MAQFSIKWPPVTQLVAALCIIGFMALILFPAFQHVGHPDNRHTCPTNLKQLGLALSQYVQDADTKFPSGVTVSGNGWAGQIYPYIKSTEVYHCPDDGQDGKFISYAENQNLKGQFLSTFVNPADIVALYEFSTANCDPSQPEAVSMTGLNAPQDSNRHDSHAFRLNFLMAGGQVKWLTPEQVSGGPGAISPKKLPQGVTLKTFAVK